MFNSHTFADKACAIFFGRAEARLSALLAEHGVSQPDELRPAQVNEIFRRAVVETAAAHFPAANLEQLDHGTRSFAHPAFIPAWERVRASTAIGSDAFAKSRGIDAAVMLAGFGLSVAPFDFEQGILEKPSNDIDAVSTMFSHAKNTFVGYSSCDAPFYVLLTDCVRTLREQVLANPGLFDIRRLFARNGGSLPPDPGKAFAPGTALFARYPGDMISTVLAMDPRPASGSILLHAGWRVEGQVFGAPFGGYLPFPAPLLRMVAYEPAVAYSLCRPVAPPPSVH